MGVRARLLIVPAFCTVPASLLALVVIEEFTREFEIVKI